MNAQMPDTDHLLDRAGAGDATARGPLSGSFPCSSHHRLAVCIPAAVVRECGGTYLSLCVPARRADRGFPLSRPFLLPCRRFSPRGLLPPRGRLEWVVSPPPKFFGVSPADVFDPHPDRRAARGRACGGIGSANLRGPRSRYARDGYGRFLRTRDFDQADS